MFALQLCRGALLRVPRLPPPEHVDLRENTKLPLRTWLLALHLLTSTKTNLAALELSCHLGVGYKTAWRLKRKIMQAMVEREDRRQLAGFVQIDDAYLGGERNGGKRGRGSPSASPGRCPAAPSATS